MKNWSRWSILVYFTISNSIQFHKKKTVINWLFYLNGTPINPLFWTLIIPIQIVWSLGPRVWHMHL